MASTVADVLPYMQAFLDARAAQAPVVANFTAAKTAAANARAAVTARVVAGDTAVMMTALLTTYVAARSTALAQEALNQAAVALTQSRYAALEQALEMLASGQDVPPFAQ